MTDNFMEETDPFILFKRWLAEAGAHEPDDPNAMALSSVDSSGMPNVRIVLLKGWDERGFVFYTNMNSTKGQEVTQSGKAEAVFYWKSLHRQIRIRGTIEAVSDAESDDYFKSRRRISRLGAWASQQSTPLDSRQTLMDGVVALEKQYPGDDIPRPAHWSGTRIKPLYIEFWQDGDYRLHDRLVFTRPTLGDGWKGERWYP